MTFLEVTGIIVDWRVNVWPFLVISEQPTRKMLLNEVKRIARDWCGPYRYPILRHWF